MNYEYLKYYIKIEKLVSREFLPALVNLRKFLWLARNDIQKLKPSVVNNLAWRNFGP